MKQYNAQGEGCRMAKERAWDWGTQWQVSRILLCRHTPTPGLHYVCRSGPHNHTHYNAIKSRYEQSHSTGYSALSHRRRISFWLHWSKKQSEWLLKRKPRSTSKWNRMLNEKMRGFGCVFHSKLIGSKKVGFIRIFNSGKTYPWVWWTDVSHQTDQKIKWRHKKDKNVCF